MKTRVGCEFIILLAIAGLWNFPVLITAVAQEQDASTSKPSLIGSTYQVTTFLGTVTIHLYEENGKLKWDGELRPKAEDRPKGTQGWEWSDSIDYDKVNFVQYTPPNYAAFIPQESSINIGQESLSFNRTVQIPAESTEGQALAEYVARKSPLGLELIGRAWCIRKPFKCPENVGPGCQDFKDLLDHGDADIAEYFYAHDESTHTHACFRNLEQSFFILKYNHTLYGDFGKFTFEEFENQQSSRSEIGDIKWHSENGFITESKLMLKPKSLGSIDLSSLAYDTHYRNGQGTKTHYTLSVRWSTGRFTETYSAKDKKGKRAFDKTGVCAKLN
jgi:hypothetical protein